MFVMVKLDKDYWKPETTTTPGYSKNYDQMKSETGFYVNSKLNI